MGARFPTGIPAARAPCASRLPGITLHAYTATATARVRRDIVAQLALDDPLELVGSFDRPNLVYRVVAAGDLKRQLQRGARASSRRGWHRVLHVATRGRCARGVAVGERCPGGPVSRWPRRRRAQPASGCIPRRRRRHRGGNGRLRDGHRSLERPLRRPCGRAAVARSTTSRNRAARAATGCRPSACSIYSGADFLKWRADARDRNGELTDARRALLRDIERYASAVGCRHRHLSLFRRGVRAKDDCGACDYCLGELEAVAGCRRRSRARSCSCVARVGQRFGTAHVANVLCGSDSRAGEGARARALDDVRVAAGRAARGSARLHRAADGARSCSARPTRPTRFSCSPSRALRC